MENKRTFGQFELHGYHIDHFLNGKYVGSIKVENYNGKDFGYASRKYLTAEEDFEVTRSNGKTFKIKRGFNYYTEVQAICGKRIEC